MANTSLKDDQDKKLNPGDADYDRKVGNDGAYVSSGLDQLEAHANDPNNSSDKSLKEREEESGRDGFYNKSVDGGGKSGGKFSGSKKKKGGIIGIVSGLIIAGVGMGGLLGPGTMLANLTGNLTGNNDSSSTVHSRRLNRVFGNMLNSDGACDAKRVKCRMGKISNKGLTNLANRGVVGVFGGENGRAHSGGRFGYPSGGNPSHYRIDMGNGRIETVSSAGLNKFMADNPKIARKVLGVKGAFNVRFNAWTGKHLSRMFNRFAINKTGGVADGKSDPDKNKSRSAKAHDKANSKLRPVNTTGANDALKKKATGKLRMASKGGSAYLVPLIGCITLKLPKIIAAGVAGVQLLQILPLISDIVLSPGDKLKSGDITPEDMETVGTILTEKTPNDEGRMTSALDSKYLLSAMGVEKGTTGMSEKFTPGYSILKNEGFQTLSKVDDVTESTCNFVMNPITMYSVMAAEMAAEAVFTASTLGVGGIGVAVKRGVGIAVGLAAGYAISEGAEALFKDMLQKYAENKNIPTARGEAMGDALGISAMAFFSSADMSNNLNVLSQSQLDEFAQISNEEMLAQKEMDIAALSPFDTSSRHTFLGSIVHTLSTSMIKHGTYNTSFSSIVSNILRIPSMASLIPTASATAGYADGYCSYASVFGLDTGNPETTPAINAAGLPCSGMTRAQDRMSTDRAFSILVDEGWIDESEDIAEKIETDDTIYDLLDKGFIVKDTPLADFVTECSDSSTGDYMFSSAGCVANSGVGTPPSEEFSVCAVEEEGEDEFCTSTIVDDDNGDAEIKTIGPPSSSSAYDAMSVFLIDYTVAQSINGENDNFGQSASTGSNSSSSDDSDNSGATTTVPTGSSQEVAKLIRDNPNITDITSARQINSMANGEKYVSSKVLQAIAGVGVNNKFTISSGKRPVINVGAGKRSWHVTGDAIDLSGRAGINGVKIEKYSSVNSTISKFLKELSDAVEATKPTSCQIGVPNNTYKNDLQKVSSCYVFVDIGSAPHIHIGVR